MYFFYEIAIMMMKLVLKSHKTKTILLWDLVTNLTKKIFLIIRYRNKPHVRGFQMQISILQNIHYTEVLTTLENCLMNILKGNVVVWSSTQRF